MVCYDPFVFASKEVVIILSCYFLSGVSLVVVGMLSYHLSGRMLSRGIGRCLILLLPETLLP